MSLDKGRVWAFGACSNYEEPDQGWEARSKRHVEEFEVHPVNLRELPKTFYFQQGG